MTTSKITTISAQDAGQTLNKNLHKGWRMYFTKSGSNLRLQSIKAKHPLNRYRLEIVITRAVGGVAKCLPKHEAIALMKLEIDRQPAVI